MFSLENFSFKDFIDHVMKEMKLDKTEEPQKSRIEKEIFNLVVDRMFVSVTNSMTQENLLQFEAIKKSVPDASSLESLFIIAEDIPLLGEALEKGVDDLVKELTRTADDVDTMLEEVKAEKEGVKAEENAK